MKKYGFGINTYYRTADVYIEEGPWYLFLAEALGELAYTPFDWLAPSHLSDRMFDLLIHDVHQWTNKQKTHTIIPIDYNDLISKVPEYKAHHDEAMAENPPHIFEKAIIVEKLPPTKEGLDGGFLLKDPVFGITIKGTNSSITRQKLKEKVIDHIHRNSD